MIEKIKNKLMGNENDKIVLLNILGSFLVKGGSLFLNLFTIPAYMRFFNDNAIYGIWLTILSVLTWILYFDVGISHGLRNNLIEPIVNKDWKAIKEYISSAYISVTVIAIGLAVAFIGLIAVMDWNKFFNVGAELVDADTLRLVVGIAVLGILLQFVFRTITSVLYALQKSFVPNMLNLISSASLLLFVIICPSKDVDSNLLTLVTANVVTVNLPLLIATFIIFSRVLKGCAPSFAAFRIKSAKAIMGLGGAFFLLQILQMLLMNTNEFIITNMISPAYVVEYQMYFKLFNVISTVFSLTIVPIWSAIAKAKAENNFVWIRSMHNKLMLMGVLGIACEFMLIPVLQFVMNIWLGKGVLDVNYTTAFLFAVMNGLFMWMTFESNVTNGLGELHIQKVFVGGGMILKFLVVLLFARALKDYRIVIIANILAILPYCIIQPLWMRRYLDKKITKQKGEVQC